MDGGLWVSPQGKAYAVEETHSVFVLENPTLFGVSEEDEKYLLSLGAFDAFKEHAFLITHALTRGWARVRFCESNIFISVIRSPHVDRLLSKVGEAILECGYPLTSIVKVCLLEKDASLLQTYYSASEETLQSLIAASYIPLYSVRENAIFSMSLSHNHRMNISNLRTMVVEAFKKRVSENTEWNIPGLSEADETNQGFGAFTWESTLTSAGNSLRVVFAEDEHNVLRVFVGQDKNPTVTINAGEGFYRNAGALMTRLGLGK